MRLYIAGPMSGIEDFNRPAFHAAEQRLVASGYEVHNPAAFLGSEDWVNCMKVGVAALCGCDGVALLHGWEHSHGVKVELDLAREFKMQIFDLDEWRLLGTF